MASVEFRTFTLEEGSKQSQQPRVQLFNLTLVAALLAALSGMAEKGTIFIWGEKFKCR
ncbi:hypothetical protein DsansV1_C35g0230291 [Dioscorea sansibarensis]